MTRDGGNVIEENHTDVDGAARPPARARDARPGSLDRTALRTLARSFAAAALVAFQTVPGWSKDKPTRFWNLTGDTVTSLALAPAGTDAYGPDQCANDRDGTVDFDERLPITGVDAGRYDVRLVLKGGRRCRVKGVAVESHEVFSIEAKDLNDCVP